MLALTFWQQFTITLIDKAVIGGILILAAFHFNRLLETFKTEQHEWLESKKRQMAVRDEEARNIRIAVAEVAKRIAAGVHSMCWLCWAAKNNPNSFDESNLINYDQEMHQVLTNLVGDRVILAALDKNTHSHLSPLADKLYSLDAEIGLAMALWRRNPSEGIKALSLFHQQASEFDDELLRCVTNLEGLKTKEK